MAILHKVACGISHSICSSLRITRTLHASDMNYSQAGFFFQFDTFAAPLFFILVHEIKWAIEKNERENISRKSGAKKSKLFSPHSK